MVNDWIAIAAMGTVAVGLPLSFLLISRLLRPSVPEKQKQITYESGEQPTGDTRIKFDIQYYLVALLFVVFDVETVLIYPWTVIFADNRSTFIPAFIFIIVLFIGLGWAWKNGGMEWLKPSEIRKQGQEQRQGGQR
ncbi:MAG: NADH-quinone oxidoreductase subunit A [Halobacteria archaeon]|nr:NADH-quinone oxidoreductase subunit A [Halobacteria archaeon]